MRREGEEDQASEAENSPEAGVEIPAIAAANR